MEIKDDMPVDNGYMLGLVLMLLITFIFGIGVGVVIGWLAL